MSLKRHGLYKQKPAEEKLELWRIQGERAAWAVCGESRMHGS